MFSLPSLFEKKMETTIVTTTEGMNQYVDLVKARITEDLMDVKSFVQAIQFNIDPLFIDEQWNMLNSKSPDELIPLTEQMLQRLNFCRTSPLIRKLEQLFPAPRGDNNEYWGDQVNVSISLAAPTGAAKKSRGGAHTYKQIKMTKGAYKELIMETQTDAARQVRKYYICLEELFIQYLLYQRAYEFIKSQIRENILEKEKTQLSIKLDTVIAQLNVQNQKLDTLSMILYNESNSKVLDVKNTQKKQELVILRNKQDPNKCEVLRGQLTHVKSQLKRKKEHMEVIGKVEHYKNPINLYNRFSESTKKQKDSRFEVLHNKVILKNGASSNELLDLFYSLDNQKHTVAKQVQSAL